MLSAKGKSAKDAVIKVKITEKKGAWSVKLKKSDLAAALGVENATVAKPGVPLEVEWELTLASGWTIAGKMTLTWTAKEGKKGKGKL